VVGVSCMRFGPLGLCSQRQDGAHGNPRFERPGVDGDASPGGLYGGASLALAP
jgi:hypothetical protein